MVVDSFSIIGMSVNVSESNEQGLTASDISEPRASTSEPLNPLS